MRYLAYETKDCCQSVFISLFVTRCFLPAMLTTISLELRDSLSPLEQTLERAIAGIELLGELPLTPDLVTDLGDHIRSLVRRDGFAEATRILTQRYPCSLAIF